MSELKISGLRKAFGNIPAVADLEFNVACGERLVILGPSGCGKTTTLRLIAGLEQPDAGTIRLGDRDLQGIAPAGRDIAMIFQNAALYPHLNVRENIAFALRSQKLAASQIEARVAQVAAAFEVTDLQSRYPQSLSGGQRSRVAVARGLAKRPRLLLLDEPLSGLDPPLRWQLQTELLKWHQQFPTTTIHVTHDQQEAMLLGDRVAVMRSGTIEQVGSPLQLYRHPESRFVAMFIGSPGMNFATVPVTARAVALGNALIPLPPSFNTDVASVDIGIRPEALRVAVEGSSLACTDQIVICGTVASVRPTGALWLLEVVWSGYRWWVASADGEAFSLGQRVDVMIDPANLHFFAPRRDTASLQRDRI